MLHAPQAFWLLAIVVDLVGSTDHSKSPIIPMFAFWQCAAVAFLLAFRAPVLGRAEESGHGRHGHVEDEHDHHGHPGSHGAHGAHSAHDEGHHGHSSQAATATNRWSEPKIDWWLGAYASAILMSVLSFAGVALMIPLRIPRMRAVVEYCSLTFAATVLVADAFIHLLPHALEGADHETMTAVGIAATLGGLSILTIPGMVEWHHRGHGHGVHAYGIANLVTEVMHNFDQFCGWHCVGHCLENQHCCRHSGHNSSGCA